MHDYIFRHNTTLNAIVTAHFIHLLEIDDAQRAATAFDAEQV